MNKDQKEARAELLANVKSFQKLREVGTVRQESYELFVDAVGEYLRAEEEQTKVAAQDLQDFVAITNDLANAIDLLTARLRSTAAVIFKAR